MERLTPPTKRNATGLKICRCSCSAQAEGSLHSQRLELELASIQRIPLGMVTFVHPIEAAIAAPCAIREGTFLVQVEPGVPAAIRVNQLFGGFVKIHDGALTLHWTPR